MYSIYGILPVSGQELLLSFSYCHCIVFGLALYYIIYIMCVMHPATLIRSRLNVFELGDILSYPHWRGHHC